MLPTKSPFSGDVRMAFDPTKSPHYKLVYCVVDRDYSSAQVHTYSSETRIWSVCGDQFPEICFKGFEEGVYWNNAIHWLSSLYGNIPKHFKLHIGNEQLVSTKLELPVTLILSVDFKLFESHGCLLLLGKDWDHDRRLTAYEMSNDDSAWSVKYIVNYADIMMPFPDSWKIPSGVLFIVLGEREEDSFMIIDLLTKVVRYNLVSKTVRTLCDLEPISSLAMLANFDCFQFIPSFAGV